MWFSHSITGLHELQYNVRAEAQESCDWQVKELPPAVRDAMRMTICPWELPKIILKIDVALASFCGSQQLMNTYPDTQASCCCSPKVYLAVLTYLCTQLVYERIKANKRALYKQRRFRSFQLFKQRFVVERKSYIWKDISKSWRHGHWNIRNFLVQIAWQHHATHQWSSSISLVQSHELHTMQSSWQQCPEKELWQLASQASQWLAELQCMVAFSS